MSGKKGTKTGNGIEMRGQSLQARLSARSKHDPITGCILWTGVKNNKGYGRLTYESKQFSAHRVSFELAYGPINSGLFVLHSCDSPLCINPKHLSLGDQSENMRQASERGRCRGGSMQGEQHHKAKLTEKDIVSIRQDSRSCTELANKYNVSIGTISSIKTFRTWRHV